MRIRAMLAGARLVVGVGWAVGMAAADGGGRVDGATVGGGESASDGGPASSAASSPPFGDAADVVHPDPGRTWGDAEVGFQLAMREGALDIRLDGRPIASYVFDDADTLRPFLAHIKTPRGRQVTRNHPPVAGEDPTDHAAMHPGLWIAFANVNGVSFWHNKEGSVVHEGFAGPPTADRHGAAFSVRNHYVARDGTKICEQRTRYRITADPAGYRIDVDAVFDSDESFWFGVKEEMGLGLRVASGIRVDGGDGTIRSAAGGRDEQGTWGQVARWWDYAGEIDGRSVGAMILSAPDNPEVWAHSRDYGLLVANPFPVDVEENRGIKTTIDPDEVFRIRFGVLIHETDSGSPLDRNKAYQRYLRALD